MKAVGLVFVFAALCLAGTARVIQSSAAVALVNAEAADEFEVAMVEASASALADEQDSDNAEVAEEADDEADDEDAAEDESDEASDEIDEDEEEAEVCARSLFCPAPLRFACSLLFCVPPPSSPLALR
jgi:hypothetical protein